MLHVVPWAGALRLSGGLHGRPLVVLECEHKVLHSWCKLQRVRMLRFCPVCDRQALIDVSVGPPADQPWGVFWPQRPPGTTSTSSFRRKHDARCHCARFARRVVAVVAVPTAVAPSVSTSLLLCGSAGIDSRLVPGSITLSLRAPADPPAPLRNRVHSPFCSLLSTAAHTYTSRPCSRPRRP